MKEEKKINDSIISHNVMINNTNYTNDDIVKLLNSLNDRYELVNKEVHSLLYDIAKNNNDIIDLQSDECDKLYTNLFIDEFGCNIEFLVLGFTIYNEKLYLIGLNANKENKTPLPLSRAELKFLINPCVKLKYKGLLYIDCNSIDISQSYLFSSVVKILYPHLIK